jgi:hypothetical protein
MVRRCNVTISPSARGGPPPAAGKITTSRIRPMARSSLSSSGRPLSLDVNIWPPVMARISSVRPIRPTSSPVQAGGPGGRDHGASEEPAGRDAAAERKP